MFHALDTSASGLVANRIRLETVAANLANANTITNESGENIPFRRRIAILQAGGPGGDPDGVHVQQIKLDDAPFQLKFMPDHPLADADGYVKHPNLDPMIEQINALEISRAYEANLQAAEATKNMLQTALQLLA